jgi:hypothetical protein
MSTETDAVITPLHTIRRVERTDTGTRCPLKLGGEWLALACECSICPTRWRLAAGFHEGFAFAGNVIDYQ